MALWHGSAELPDNITLLKLPPYSPELNPMENVWAYLRANKLAISVFDNYADRRQVLRSMELLCKRQNRNHVNHYQTMGQNLGPLVLLDIYA